MVGWVDGGWVDGRLGGEPLSPIEPSGGFGDCNLVEEKDLCDDC